MTLNMYFFLLKMGNYDVLNNNNKSNCDKKRILHVTKTEIINNKSCFFNHFLKAFLFIAIHYVRTSIYNTV